MKKVMSVAALLAMAGAAQGQINGLLAGVDDAQYDVMVWQNGGWQSLFTPQTNSGVYGLAADPATQTVYYNQSAELWSWNANTGHTLVGTINVSGDSTGMTALDFDTANNRLIGAPNIGGNGGLTPEAVYAIDPATANASVLWDFTALDYDFGGFGYDPVTDTLYGTSDDATPARGVYTIDPGNMTANHFADYPAGETDIDGLAAWNNRLFLVHDQAGDFYELDATNPGAGYTTFPGPWSTSEIFSGATVAPWLIPTPGSLALLGLGGLAAVRRRR